MIEESSARAFGLLNSVFNLRKFYVTDFTLSGKNFSSSRQLKARAMFLFCINGWPRTTKEDYPLPLF